MSEDQGLSRMPEQDISIRRAWNECLSYVQQFVPAFDVASLQTPIQLPRRDPRDWETLLAQAPVAVALRSFALQHFAERQVESRAFWDADLATAFFQEARRRLSAEGPASAHHLDLTVDGEWSRPQAFLVVEPAQSLSDGAARLASSGYFDDDNFPPWDTWVTAVPPRPEYEQIPGLLCWVPEWAHEHVERGIEVNPEECLHWAEIRDDTVVWR